MRVTSSGRGWSVRLTGLAALVLAGFLWVSSSVQAQEVRAAPHGDYGRIVFDWKSPVNFSANVVGGALVVQFDQPFQGSVANVGALLPGYLGAGQVSSDKRTLTFPLKGNFKVNGSRQGTSVVVDIQGPPADGPVATKMSPGGPDLSAPSSGRPTGPLIPVRTGTHDGFFRVVFDWPKDVPYSVDTKDGTAVVSFRRPGRIDTGRLNGLLPAGQGGATATGTPDSLTVTLPLSPGGSVRHFRSGSSVAVDLHTKGGDAPSTPVPAPSAQPVAAAAAVVPPPVAPSPVPVSPPAPGAASAGASAAGGVSAVIPPASGVSPAQPPAPTAAPTTPVTVGSSSVMQPAPNLAPAVETGGAALSNAGFSFPFSWNEPSSAAAFRRAGYVWVVFDKPTTVDLDAFRRAAGSTVSFVEQIDTQGRSTALRMAVGPEINPSFRREGLAWILEMNNQPLAPVTPLPVTSQTASTSGPRIYIPINEGGTVLSFLDPEVGDLFYVVPVMPLGNGIYPAARFPDLTLPMTAQGILIDPIRDDIKVRSSRQGIEITADGGLTLSESKGSPQIAGLTMGRSFSKIFDVGTWFGDQKAPFPRRQSDAQMALLDKFSGAPADRNAARLDLARFMFANGRAAEALGLLDLIEEADVTGLKGDPDVRALRGAVSTLLGRNEEAVTLLSDPALLTKDEAALWRAVALVNQGGAAATDDIKRFLASAHDLVAEYPPSLRVPLALVAAEAALGVDDDRAVHDFLEMASISGANTIDQLAQIAYLDGRYQELLGDYDAARESYESAENMRSLKWSLRALRARLSMDYDLDRIPAKELIDGLEHIRFSWRGDDFEFDVLRQLDGLYLKNGDPGSALRTLKTAAQYFPNRPDSPDLTAEMKRIFEELFLNGASDKLDPVTAIALYDEFRELTPTDERGDEMISRLSDSLVKVDLLDQAAYLLEHQLATRLSTPGEAQAKIGARLALLRLLNGQSDQALRVLENTDYPQVSPALKMQRNQLEARALADLGSPDRAIALLEGDNSRDALVLRTEIFWKTENWREVSRTISRLVPVPGRGEKLSDQDALHVLDWATALTLAGDEPQTALLRRRYLESLRGTIAFDGFNLITSPRDHGFVDTARITENMARADKFRSFLAAYGQKVRENGLSTMN